MGIGPPLLALYGQLKDLGTFDDVHNVMELGSQNVWSPHTRMVEDLFASYGRTPSQKLLDEICNANATSTAFARDVYEGLGMEFNCVDSDGRAGALALDLNFDPVPEGHRNRYDLVTNHGTTEHVFNQLNSFKMIHDLTKPGGLMLHALPFFGQWDHGFFNYQPNLFKWLGKYNSYKTLGVWMGIAWNLSSLIPWQPHLLDHLRLKSDSTGLLIVLQKKMYDTEFSVPFQEQFGALEMRTEEVAENYSYVVDGELVSGNLDSFVTQDSLIAGEVKKQLDAHIANLGHSGVDISAEVAARNTTAELQAMSLSEQCAHLQAQYNAALQEAAALRHSTSWKLTAPLRAIMARLRR